MPFGPFAMQWRAPSPNPPLSTPLPAGITRSQIPTAYGPLELLTALPTSPIDPSQPPLFFAHGGFGCAEVWLSFMQFFASRGIPCYAMSYRGHGKSWYPGFWRMYFTTRGAIAEDLATGVKHVERLESDRRGMKDGVQVVLVAHSAGGALSQYALSRKMVSVRGFCMFAGVPGFGSFGCYTFWALSVPFNFPYRLYHSRYLLATTQQVQDAFFTPSTPSTVVKSLERLLAPYESMLWPVQALFRFITGSDVLSSIYGWAAKKPAAESKHSDKGGEAQGVRQGLFVLAAEHDVLCTPSILLDAAQRYRAAFGEMVAKGQVEGVSKSDLRGEKEQGSDWDGVRFRVVPGLGHHLQNHVEWEKGAEELLQWVEQL